MTVPSCAVTTTLMLLSPTLRLIVPEGVAEVTGAPLTFTLAWASATLGVTMRLPTLLATVAT